MAWIKIPVEHHSLFRAALPRDPRVETLLMFGGVAAKVNGHLFAGLFARSVIVGLSDADRAEALALDGAAYFDPWGDGRMQSQKILLPDDVMEEPRELRAWLARAFAYTAGLPPKRAAKKPVAKKPMAKRPVAKKPVAKKPVAKKPVAQKPVGKKPVANKRASPPPRRAVTSPRRRPAS
ncbi:MAG TPA: TfoX/Sxy family protein [Kofleriaceae bacterium]|nr:TfoX/Sxy family protein [Kofleriaceae bacterium]